MTCRISYMGLSRLLMRDRTLWGWTTMPRNIWDATALHGAGPNECMSLNPMKIGAINCKYPLSARSLQKRWRRKYEVVSLYFIKWLFLQHGFWIFIPFLDFSDDITNEVLSIDIEWQTNQLFRVSSQMLVMYSQVHPNATLRACLYLFCWQLGGSLGKYRAGSTAHWPVR